MGLLFLPAWGGAEGWSEKKSQHFIVYYIEDVSYASEVVRWAEDYYDRMNTYLGFNHVLKRDREFWLWEERCQIYLYPNSDLYLKTTKAHPASTALVFYSKREIHTVAYNESFFSKELPHELAHIMFREFVGNNNSHVPLWLDEGIAQYAEPGRLENAFKMMIDLLEHDLFLPFEKFNRFSIDVSSRGEIEIFYNQAVTLIHFFLDQYGDKGFIKFCKHLRDGYDINRALSYATGSRIQTLGDLELAWRAYMLL